MENGTLTQKEQARLQVLNSLLTEHMTLDQAATLMGVTTRHTRRILAAYREKGVAAVAHGHRGRRPPNATPEPVATAVVHLARTRYAGANHTHLSELLSERDGIDIGRTTLRRILVNAGLSSPRRRRPPKHRVRRQRMPREGMLIQMAGSHHPWLGGQAPPFTLLIAVDDATGTVVDALFCEQEDAHSYFLLIQGLVQHVGIPVALYTDRHGVFRHTPGSGLPGMPTQFSRAMDELGSQMIFALSPQAKGRVERTGGTFQDRLVTELRLAGASGLGEANRVLEQFLPRFNRRFRVPPQHPEPAFRPLDPELCLEQVLCFKHRRKVARDNTVRFQLHTRFYNGRGTAEQWIKEGKYALNWTRLSCHKFVANQVRLWLFVLTYNLGNFMRRLVLPEDMKHWTLTSLQTRLIKTGGRLVRHARRLVFQLAEVLVTREMLTGILERISRLRLAPG